MTRKELEMLDRVEKFRKIAARCEERADRLQKIADNEWLARREEQMKEE